MSKRRYYLLIIAVFGLSWLGFTIYSLMQMSVTPLHDYDEANRAEGARNMLLHNDYLSPLSGGPYGRRTEASIPYSLNENVTISPRTERPPLVFILMTIFTRFLGDTEISYRLPSLIFGLIGLGIVAYVLKSWLAPSIWVTAGAVGFLSLFTSIDWWHSSQMAHLDTGLSVGLLIGLVGLIQHGIKPDKKWLIIAGLGIGLAILSKAQPAILTLFAILPLWLLNKITVREVFLVLGVSVIVSSPWWLGLMSRYGIENIFHQQVVGVATGRAVRVDESQVAPIFWYFRWWLDMFRPGIILLLSVSVVAMYKKMFTWKAIVLGSFIFGSFVLFSLARNKVWWYLLPTLPAVALFLGLVTRDYLASDKLGLVKLSIVIILASLPLALFLSNTAMLLYGLVLVSLCTLILIYPFKIEVNKIWQRWLFVFSLTLSIIIFGSRFPQINPTHWETRPVAIAYQDLPTPKCLWVDQDLPYEAPLFYSKAGEINYFDSDANLKTDCENYLITNQPTEFEVIYKEGVISLVKLNLHEGIDQNDEY